MSRSLLEDVATYVVTNQVGRWPTLLRRMRVGHTTLTGVLADLEALGVLGPADPRGNREVLVSHTNLDTVLDKIRAYERGEPR